MTPRFPLTAATQSSASALCRGAAAVADAEPGVAAVPPQSNTARTQPKRRKSKHSGGIAGDRKRRRSSQQRGGGGGGGGGGAGFLAPSEVAEGDRDLVAALLRQSPVTDCRLCKTELRVCYLDTTQMMLLCPTQGCGFPFRAADMEAFIHGWHDEHSHRDPDPDPQPHPLRGAGAWSPTAAHSEHQSAPPGVDTGPFGTAKAMGRPGVVTQNDFLDGINDIISGSTETTDAVLAPAPPGDGSDDIFASIDELLGPMVAASAPGPTPSRSTSWLVDTTATASSSAAPARETSPRSPTKPKKKGWSMDSEDDWGFVR